MSDTKLSGRQLTHFAFGSVCTDRFGPRLLESIRSSPSEAVDAASFSSVRAILNVLFLDLLLLQFYLFGGVVGRDLELALDPEPDQVPGSRIGILTSFPGLGWYR